MNELIKDKAIRDSIGVKVSRYYCTDCANTFLNVDSQPVICPCQNKQPKQSKIPLYYGVFDNDDNCVCVYKEIKGIKNILKGRIPNKPFSVQLLGDSASSFSLSDCLSMCSEQNLKTNKSKGNRYNTTEIKEFIAKGVTYQQLKSKYGISKRTYYNLLKSVQLG